MSGSRLRKIAARFTCGYPESTKAPSRSLLSAPQSKIIPPIVDGKLADAPFEDAIKYNRQRPQWFKNTV